MTRKLNMQVEELRVMELEVDHLIYPWMVEFAAKSTNIGRREPDGRTAWELRLGS